MGLTVHFKFEFEGTAQEAESKIKKVRELGLQLREKKFLSEVSQVFQLDYEKDFNDENENLKRGGVDRDLYRWIKIQYDRRPWQEGAEDKGISRGWAVSLWAGEGCEPTNVGLVSSDGRHWSGEAFTKTQYAHDFLKAHITVIAILDFCGKIDILKEVSDEGGYWETRDLKTLGKNINESTAFLKTMSGIIKDVMVKTGGVLEAPIEKSQNFMVVKEEQVKKSKMSESKKDILRTAGMGKQVDRVEMGKCPLCGKVIQEGEFKDELSKKEFDISGMCQKCQDGVFEGGE